MSKFRNSSLSVLSTTATKREARQYIQKYGSNNITKPVSSHSSNWAQNQFSNRSEPLTKQAQYLISIVRISGRNNHEALKEPWISGIARTLSQIKDLGGFPLVVIDGSPQIQAYLGPNPRRICEYESELAILSERLASSLVELGVPTMSSNSPLELSANDGYVVKRDWSDRTLSQDQIPISLPRMYDLDSNETKSTDSYNLCRELVLSLKRSHKRKDEARAILDKIIFIDPLGGLPSQRRKHAAHVLVNLKQEYGEISSEIRTSPISTPQDVEKREAHLTNSNSMNEMLNIGGPQTTGIITDPRAASHSLDRNPIIYNLLTDRPLISPSLPAELERSQLRTSLLRTGFPVYVRSSQTEGTSELRPLDLRREDKVGNINLTKSKRLIELSFKKTLDLDHYLNRIEDKVAAIIVVGDYDGAAIITWETSPLTGRQIAYLDKFAVDPSSQGAQGVADIMLIQMIRRLFPKEMLWRSRSNNPVNKWYFERSRGHTRSKDSIWTMFWISDATTPSIEEYESVCRNIEPSLH